MKALQKNAPFGENTYGLQKSYHVHKHRIKNMRKCIDNETPKSFVGQSGPRSPNRRVVAKQMAEENLRRENFMLARRIFKIMQGESDITQSINNNEHIENHPGTMNFRRRLEEAQRIHHKNLMFAIRMQTIQPYYRNTDLSIVHASKNRSNSPGKSKGYRKTKFMKEFEYSLQMAEEQTSSVDESGSLGVYQGFMVDEQSQSTSPKGEPHGYHNKRPRTILLQYTKAQDNRILDVVVLKEPFRDRYAIFGLDVDDGQRFELRLTSEDVSNILDGDILVTSVDNVEVWMALLNKVRLKPVPMFNQVPFTNQEIDLLSSNGLAFDFPVPFPSSSTTLDPTTKSMTSTPNTYGDRLPSATGAPTSSGGQRPKSRAPQSRGKAGGQSMPNPDEFERLPFDYGQDNDDVPLSSRTEASGGGSRPATSSRPVRTPNAHAPRSRPQSDPGAGGLNMGDYLESDAETAEMIRASDAAAALAAKQQQKDVVTQPDTQQIAATTTTAPAVDNTTPATAPTTAPVTVTAPAAAPTVAAAPTATAPALTPRQPTSRPSSKPASGRVTSARTTTVGTTHAANTNTTTTGNSLSTPAGGNARPVPPSKPKTPNATPNQQPNTNAQSSARPSSIRGTSVASRPQSMVKPNTSTTKQPSSGNSNVNASVANKPRPEEKAQLAQTVAAQMTQEKLVTSPSKLPEGFEELFSSTEQREATEEFAGIVSDVTNDAVLHAVSSISDNLLAAGSVHESVNHAVQENDKPTADSVSVQSPLRDSVEYEDESFETLEQSAAASTSQQQKASVAPAVKGGVIEENIPDESS